MQKKKYMCMCQIEGEISAGILAFGSEGANFELKKYEWQTSWGDIKS